MPTFTETSPQGRLRSVKVADTNHKMGMSRVSFGLSNHLDMSATNPFVTVMEFCPRQCMEKVHRSTTKSVDFVAKSVLWNLGLCTFVLCWVGLVVSAFHT